MGGIKSKSKRESNLKAKAKKQSLLITKKFFRGIQSCENPQEKFHRMVESTKVKNNPKFSLGEKLIRSGTKTIAINHDQHLYGRA